MTESNINGIEITIYDEFGDISLQPTYEAHSVAKAQEILNNTADLLQGTNKTLTFRLF